jgi:glyoxylase-like metal-dependent hydrolase (beta-lactamase superfamily II)
MEKLTAGLWRWTARHPEWHPGEFGAEVVSFAADAGDGTLLLIDPLLPSEPDEVLEQLDTIAAGAERVAILISIPYHVRSAEELRKRYRATIHGHKAAAKRLSSQAGFHEIETGTELPGGVTAYPIGKPRRHETPLHLPSHKALVFGDSVAEYDGALRVWADGRIDAKAKRFYRERFNPTLEPLLDLDFDAVLVTHGAPVMTNGKEALRRALEAEPWSRHG